jgi:hypothetical protein
MLTTARDLSALDGALRGHDDAGKQDHQSHEAIRTDGILLAD